MEEIKKSHGKLQSIFYLPYDLVERILMLCGEREIKLFIDIYPQLLRNITVHDLRKVKPENHKYVKKLKASENLIDDDLKMLSNLTTLFCMKNRNLTDSSLKMLSNLTTLHCRENTNFTNESLKMLSNLTTLYCGENTNFTQEQSSQVWNRRFWYRSRAFGSDFSIVDTLIHL